MRVFRLLIFLFLAISATPALLAQTKIADITIPNSLKISGKTLILNGAGVREKFFMDLYVGGLYLTEKKKNPDAIIQANEAMAIRIEIISSMITSSKMIDAVNEGFKKSTNGNTVALKDKIAQFTKAFNEEIKIGDVFEIVYDNNAILITKNGKAKATIQGFDFKKAVFGIWLGNEPADDDLKSAMLSN